MFITPNDDMYALSGEFASCKFVYTPAVTENTKSTSASEFEQLVATTLLLESLSVIPVDVHVIV